MNSPSSPEVAVPNAAQHSATHAARREWASAGVQGLGWALCTFACTLAAWVGLAMLMPDREASIVMSGSMSPRIEPGDAVITRPMRTDEDIVGRVVRVRRDRRTPLMHRVVDAGPGWLKTRGDANHDIDSTVATPNDVTGVGHLLIPWVGLPAVWIHEGDFGSLALLAAGVVLIANMTQFRRRSGGRRTRRRRITVALAAVGILATTVIVTEQMFVSTSFASTTTNLANSFQAGSIQPAAGVTVNNLCTVSWTATPSTFSSGYTVQRWKKSGAVYSLDTTNTITPRTTTSMSGSLSLVILTTYQWRVIAVIGTWQATAAVSPDYSTTLGLVCL